MHQIVTERFRVSQDIPGVLECCTLLQIGIRVSQSASLQSMADLEKILGAPTVPHLRCGWAKTVKKMGTTKL